MWHKLVLAMILLLPMLLQGQCELSSLTNRIEPEIESPVLAIQNVESEFQTKHIPYGESIIVKHQKFIDTVVVSEHGAFVLMLYETGDYEFVTTNATLIKHIRVMPLWYSIIPPLLAIVLAMIFKEVLTALLFGLFSGTVAIAWFSGNGSFGSALFTGLFDLIDHWIVQTIADADHASVMLFSLLIGAVVQFIRK